MILLISLILVQLTTYPIPENYVESYTITNNPLIFEYHAYSRGFLSVVARCEDPSADITIYGRGPNSLYLFLSGGSSDADVSGNTGYEQTIFDIPGPGKYYIIINPYESFITKQTLNVLSWFYHDEVIISEIEIPEIEINIIKDLSDITGHIDNVSPLAVYQIESYDNKNNFIFGRVEANEDVILELYLPENPLNYVYQSDFDYDGNAGNEEILFLSSSDQPIFIIRPYANIESEIIFNFSVDIIHPDENLVISNGSAIDEAFIDPQMGQNRFTYSFNAPSNGITVINIRGEGGDLILNAYSSDTVYSSDMDIDGNTAYESLILSPGKYMLEITNQPSNLEPVDFVIEAIFHEDKNATAENSIELSLGVKNSDILSPDSFDYIDYFKFIATNPGIFHVETMGLSGYGDLILSVENREGVEISYSDQDLNGDCLSEMCEVELQPNEIIYIKVSPYYEYESDFETCPYSIVITKEE